MSSTPSGPEGTHPPNAAALRARLEASRTALLEAIARLTEQDFAAELEPGLSVAGLLASLAAAERDAVEAVRDAAARTARSATRATRSSALAPQAIHDLAGARFETLRALAAIEGAAGSEEAAIGSLVPVAEREEAAAEGIGAKFRSE